MVVSSSISFLTRRPLSLKKSSSALRSSRLMLLNCCEPAPDFMCTVMSKVERAATAPDTREKVMDWVCSYEIYVAGLGTNMKAFSRQYRKPSLALMEHLMPYCCRCLDEGVQSVQGRMKIRREEKTHVVKSLAGAVIFLLARPLKMYATTWCSGCS